MIKINLLNNQFEAPLQAEVSTDTKESVARVIKQEAKKSSRRVVVLMIIFMIIIFGGISLFIYRYEAVAFVEQYTGPLNLLAPVEEGPTAEQLEKQRQEKIRQLYMDNTIRLHRRDISFFTFIDSLIKTTPVFVRYATLDNNDYSIEFFGRTEKEMKDFTAAFLTFKVLESNKINEIEPGSRVPGFRFRRVLNGTLRVPAVVAEVLDVKTTYLMVDKSHKKLQLIALESKLKLAVSRDLKSVKGVVMTKYSGEFKIAGAPDAYLKFLTKVNGLYLNIEFTHHEITYPRKSEAGTITVGYNVLIPTDMAESKN